MLILTEKKVTTVNLSLHREGIKDYLTVFGDKQKFHDLTGINIDDEKLKEEAKEAQKEKVPKDKLLEFFTETKPATSPFTAKKEIDDSQKIDIISEIPENKLKNPFEEIKEEKEPVQIVKREKLELVMENEELPTVEAKDEPTKVEVKEESQEEKKEDEKLQKEQKVEKEAKPQQEEEKEEEKEQKVEKKEDEEPKVVEEEKEKKETTEVKSSEAAPKVVSVTKEIFELKHDFIADEPRLTKESLEEKKEELDPLLANDYQEMMFGLEEAEGEGDGEGEENIQGYFSDLQAALKNSMSEVKDTKTGEIDEKLQLEVAKEKAIVETEMLKQKKEKLEKEKKAHKENLKRMFIKKAIQNLDENFQENESFKNFGNFEENEIRKIKDIIAKKKEMKNKQPPEQDSRKYSRDYIGMNTAPMYKNIFKSAKKVLKEMEKNLQEEYSEEASILERLSKLSEEFNKESKNARVFDEAKTTDLFQSLVEFFDQKKNFNKITQYELCKSNIVHSLQSFLSLPIKEEESKSSSNEKEKVIEKDSDEYMTILSRYLCFLSIFLSDESSKAFKNFIVTLENAMKVSFSNYYSSELSAYHDGVNLAFDMKKYSKRNKLQLVYNPDILNKIKEDEEAEKGNTGYKTFKASLVPKGIASKKYKDKGFEDEEFLKKFPEPRLDKFVSKQETTKPLVEEVKDEDAAKSSKSIEESDHTSVYLKRDALYRNLKAVNVSVESSSTLDVILDFLKNKIVNKEQVQSLKQQNNYNSNSQQMAEILDRARQQFTDNEGEGDSSGIQSMLQKIAVETLNESGQYSSMNREEKLMLFKDLETLLGESPPPGMDFGIPAPRSKTFVNLQDSKSKKAVNEEEKRMPVEEERKSKDTSSAANEILSQDVPKENKKWNFFGKIKKLFFEKKMPLEAEFEAEGEDFEEDIMSTPLEEMHDKVIDPPEVDETNEDTPKEEKKKDDDEEEKIETTKEKHIDLPVDLDILQENEDVVFEFYYNRMKIPNTRTVYELINYQPTHRQIVDQYIIYYRIVDR